MAKRQGRPRKWKSSCKFTTIRIPVEFRAIAMAAAMAADEEAYQRGRETDGRN